MTDEPEITVEDPGYAYGYQPINGYLTIKPKSEMGRGANADGAVSARQNSFRNDLDWEHMG